MDVAVAALRWGHVSPAGSGNLPAIDFLGRRSLTDVNQRAGLQGPRIGLAQSPSLQVFLGTAWPLKNLLCHKSLEKGRGKSVKQEI